MSSIPSVAKAWRYPVDQTTWDGYKSLEIRDVQVSPPQKGEVLVRLHAAAFNYSEQAYPGPFSTGPDGQGLIPTCDGAGEIVAIGEGVSGWKIGDRVHSLFYEEWFDGPPKTEYLSSQIGSRRPGCLTQYRTFSAETILAIPDHLSYEESASVPCAAITAWAALFEEGHLSKDSTVLVLGSGGVSVFGAQLAKAAGARVIATTSSKEKEQKYKTLGVDHVVNYREHPEWYKKVKELTDGEGVEQVLDIGGQGTVLQSIKSVQRGGIVHIIGALAHDTSTEKAGDVTQAVLFGQCKASLSGLLVGNRAMAKRLDAFMAQHKIKPVVGRVFEWTEAIDALDYQVKGSHFGKIVIKIE